MSKIFHSKGSMESGQTIVEIIVAIGVIVLLITGLVAGATGTLKAAQYGRAKSTAIRYSEESFELARSLRDKGWETFLTYGSPSGKSWCLDKAGVWTDGGGSGCPEDIDAHYSRTVTFTWQDPKMKIETVVAWDDGGKTYHVDLVTYLTQWQ